MSANVNVAEHAPTADFDLEVDCVLWIIETGTSPVEACATFEMPFETFTNAVMASAAQSARYIHAVHAQHTEKRRIADELGTQLVAALQWRSAYRKITTEMCIPQAMTTH